jgi:hypothetical protein
VSSRSSPRHPWLLPLAIFVLALLPRGVQLAQLRANAPTFTAPEGGDSIFYDRVASGASVPPRAYFHSPLYRWFVSGSYRLFGRDLLALRLLQLLIGALGAALAALLARRLFSSELCAAIAGGLVAICGPLIFYEAILQPACDTAKTDLIQKLNQGLNDLTAKLTFFELSGTADIPNPGSDNQLQNGTWNGWLGYSLSKGNFKGTFKAVR